MTSVHRLVAVSLFVAASSVSLFRGQERTRSYRTYRIRQRPTHDFAADSHSIGARHHALVRPGTVRA